MVFVFGSNLAGRHGKGAALFARKYKGAVYGQGEGFQGNSYAIPTKDAGLKTLPIKDIEKHVKSFLVFASLRLDLEFEITNVGCGLAGYSPEQIAPLFTGATANCHFSEEFIKANAMLKP